MEVWKDIKNYENYQISNFGNVKSLNFNHTKKEKLLKLLIRRNGYLYIDLCKNNIVKRFNVHRLVAIHFISNPNNKLEVNHKDGNKQNNNIDNLEWCTRKENEYHARFTGLSNFNGENNCNAKFTWQDVIWIRSLVGMVTIKRLASIFNINRSTIERILNYKTWNYT